jgi:lambda family phage portal protein
VAERPTLIDRMIGYFSPETAARRAYFRESFATTYRGAVRSRLDSGWTPLPGGGARQNNRNLRESFREMRARARQLEQDNVLAGAVLDRAVENVIGVGLRARPTSSSPEFNKQAAACWKRWTGGKTADIRHAHTFGAMQRMLYRAKLRDGDAGVLLTEEQDLQGRKHPRLQIIEGEVIDNPLGGAKGEDGVEVIDGIELGDQDQAVGYYLLPRNGLAGGRPTRIRARDFVYLCRPALYSSVRGESAFNGGWTLFDQIVGYLESVVVASRVAASQAILITKNSPAGAITSLPTLGGSAAAGTESRKSFGIEPGMVQFLAPGESMESFNPAQPQQQMESAINTFCRFVGLRFGLTIEQVLLNFALTTYSSGRAARLQAEQTATMEQDDFAATFFSRVYPWAVAKWVKAGLITAPAPPDGSAYAYEWIPQGRPWVDPTKEIAAAQKAIELGLEAPSYIATERGYDYGDLQRQIAEDVATRQRYGLVTVGIDGTPPAAAAAVVTAPDPVVTAGGPANG